MPDIREMLALLLGQGSMKMQNNGGVSDIQQRLLAALARVRPTWAGDCLLACYADDSSARRSVEYALITELAGMVWPEKNPPGTLRGIAYLVMAEYIEPPSCLSCAGTGMTWRMVEGAIQQLDCPACRGRGRRRFTDDEMADISGLPWDVWGPRYARLHKLLRANERAALATMREAMGEVLDSTGSMQ